MQTVGEPFLRGEWLRLFCNPLQGQEMITFKHRNDPDRKLWVYTAWQKDEPQQGYILYQDSLKKAQQTATLEVFFENILPAWEFESAAEPKRTQENAWVTMLKSG